MTIIFAMVQALLDLIGQATVHSPLCVVLIGALLASLFLSLPSDERSGWEHAEELAARLEELTAEYEILEADRNNLMQGFQRFQKMVQGLPIACIGVCPEGKIYEWNAGAIQTFGHDYFSVFENSVVEVLIDDEDQEKFQKVLEMAVATDSIQTVQTKCKSFSGETIYGDWSAAPMSSASGKVSSLVLVCSDVTAKVLETERLHEMAVKDALTGLMNRRAIMTVIADNYEQARPDAPLSIILFDVDKFKVFNDTHGHPAGDQLLKRAGSILADLSHENLFTGRYGGEEFIAVLPNSDILAAINAAENIRTTFAENTLDLFGGATASFGVATCDGRDLTIEELIQSADQALYEAKRQGRNRVIPAQPQSSRLAS